MAKASTPSKQEQASPWMPRHPLGCHGVQKGGTIGARHAGNMHFSRYPFAISIRTLKEQNGPIGGHSAKRHTEADAADRDSKRRSPTPEGALRPQQAPLQAPLQAPCGEMQQLMKQELGQGIPDPWAVAAAATATPSQASGSQTAPTMPASESASEIKLGDRISA